MITATLDTRQFERGIRRLVGRDLPFAMALTLTSTAKDVRVAEQTAASATMTLRSRWVHRGFQVTAAQKSDGIDRMESRVGHRDWYIAQQMGESTTTRTPRSKRYLYVPLSGVRKHKRQKIRRSQSPGALLRQKTIFFLESKGRTYIARILSGQVTLMYIQIKRQPIDPKASFKQVFEVVVRNNIGFRFIEAAKRAIETRR